MTEQSDPLDEPDTQQQTTSSELIEGRDYYWEGASMVFTAYFLLKRGFCCESGCRHCPYE